MGKLPLHRHRPLEEAAPLGEDDDLDLNHLLIHGDDGSEVVPGEVREETLDGGLVLPDPAPQLVEAGVCSLMVADDSVVVVGGVPELVELLALNAEQGELEEALRRPVGLDVAEVEVLPLFGAFGRIRRQVLGVVL